MISADEKKFRLNFLCDNGVNLIRKFKKQLIHEYIFFKRQNLFYFFCKCSKTPTELNLVGSSLYTIYTTVGYENIHKNFVYQNMYKVLFKKFLSRLTGLRILSLSTKLNQASSSTSFTALHILHISWPCAFSFSVFLPFYLVSILPFHLTCRLPSGQGLSESTLRTLAPVLISCLVAAAPFSSSFSFHVYSFRLPPGSCRSFIICLSPVTI